MTTAAMAGAGRACCRRRRRRRTPAKQPKPGGSLTFQISSQPPSLDPYTQTSFVAAYNHGLSYSKLFRFKAGTPDVAPADNSMEPDLAQAMPEQPDQLTFVVKLKPNAKFHNVAPVNGRAVTSKDIAYAFDRYKNYEKSVHKTGLAFIDKVETPDDQTVRITTKQPYADFVFYLGGNLGAWICPQEWAESQEVATKMIGSGPFLHTEFKTGVSLSYKKNPDYFDKPYPYFDEVTALIVTDQAKRVADFSSKQVNLTMALPADGARPAESGAAGRKVRGDAGHRRVHLPADGQAAVQRQAGAAGHFDGAEPEGDPGRDLEGRGRTGAAVPRGLPVGAAGEGPPAGEILGVQPRGGEEAARSGHRRGEDD
ncbi:ABC transporter substrate-binding protein [Tepidiforma flava]|uniref:ABC transporter substrate-binding protein n=1 Tax=Tepidiforma flava TaxID=3004094 RepID=A0ABY7M3U0_9CHLR|nr:ABC transporter substrate-binding protein [Tepidiforma flava]WBL35240.1 ABC transporter substrate-binding protein [Tepidiforma flava]